MSDKKLDIEFQEAVASVNAHQEPFPADTLLKLYAYYKRATNDYGRPRSREALINPFKKNALFPAKKRVWRFFCIQTGK